MDYSKTLNLPKTDFPMRANLPAREPEVLAFWDEIKVNDLISAAAADRPQFILHDGPPYANGNIHLGTALNKVLKDIVNKFMSMQGYNTPYVPGWDTHGLPIETAVIKNTGANPHEMGTVKFRRHCRDYALKFLDIQRDEFKRLGVRGDWEHPYVTLVPEFEAKQIEVFGAMAKKGYIYKGLKPVYWCADCATALAEAEVEYADHVSPSIYVKFRLIDSAKLLGSDEPVDVLIWTTTPWTLPANVAIALGREFDYAFVQAPGTVLVMAEQLVDTVMQETGISDYSIRKVVKGSDLEKMECRHPFLDRNSLLILADHVLLDQGTGCVHTAPGHGLEDYEVGVKYNLPVVQPLDSRGRFTDEGGKFAGMFCGEANKAIIDELKDRGALVQMKEIKHSYPHCWRCKQPVIYRATEQWFASVDGFRREALAAIEDVKWIPAWGEERIHNMVADRLDWCISRQRVWGVPIPVFYCRACGKELITDESIAAVRDLFAREGSDAWFSHEAAEILPPGTSCPDCGTTDFRKETDIMDVWFDSGSSHLAVLESRNELRWPADLYLEGSDQHRGWFQSSLLTSVAVRGTAPYRSVLTHGFVVDGEGRKMSKSLGNVIYPQEVIKEFGADVLRLWVASSDFKADISVSPDILKQMSEVYRKIRNTCRFILGNLSDFDPAKDVVPYGSLPEIDRWALLRLTRLVRRVTEAYRNYDYHLVYHALHNFCAIDMSALYLDILKDRLYTTAAAGQSRRAAQTVLQVILTDLVRLMAPILTFTAEEIWRYLPAPAGKPVTVQLAGWPTVCTEYEDAALAARWEKLLELRETVAKSLEAARKGKVIGQSLAAKVDLYPDAAWAEFLQPYLAELKTIFIVSRVDVHEPGETVPAEAATSEDLPELKVLIRPAAGVKCERCWSYSEETGKDAEHPNLCPRCLAAVRE
ncbi:MAG: isoleucine--tRNA ligase [bacterium]|jgi:isoleucyl-tRNA synthetase